MFHSTVGETWLIFFSVITVPVYAITSLLNFIDCLKHLPKDNRYNTDDVWDNRWFLVLASFVAFLLSLVFSFVPLAISSILNIMGIKKRKEHKENRENRENRENELSKKLSSEDKEVKSNESLNGGDNE